VPYLPGTLFPYIRGLLRNPTNVDGITEVSPSAGTFTTKQVLATGDTLEVVYNDTSTDPGDPISGVILDQELTGVILDQQLSGVIE
jgi:hypothetical protein